MLQHRGKGQAISCISSVERKFGSVYIPSALCLFILRQGFILKICPKSDFYWIEIACVEDLVKVLCRF